MQPGRLPYRILVVEDVPDIQMLVARVLQEEGAEVSVAENGERALERVSDAERLGQPFHCILMDVKMPVLGGREATRRLREGGYTGGIIAVTGWIVEDHAQQCLENGCDAFLAKPFHTEELVRLVAKIASTAR